MWIGVAPGAGRRLAESLLAAWIVAGGLIAVVYSSGAVRDAVRSAPWLLGPGLWVTTALAAGALLCRLPERDYPGRALALATLADGTGDALVVYSGPVAGARDRRRGLRDDDGAPRPPDPPR